jgi:predicted MFS family arabinose efflux permease
VAGGALSAAYGWRMSLVMMGGIGLILALALPFLIPEPPRGASSGGAPVKPQFKDTFSQLISNRTYLFMMVGISVGNFAGIGVISWLPLFFQRSHGMSHSELSFIFGPALSIGMIIGMLSGGWVGDQLSTRFGKVGPLYLCMAATITVALLYYVILLVPVAAVAIALIVIAAGLSIIYIPAYSVVLQSILQPHVRATGLAVLVFMSNVLGLGILPVVVGAMSDRLTAQVGADGLRYALIVVLSGNFISAWAFSKARKNITA